MDIQNLIQNFDETIIFFIQNTCHNTVTDTIFPIITYIGEAGIVWILLAFLMIIFKKSRIYGILILVAMLGCYLFGELFLKNVICRVRPCNQFPDIKMLIAKPLSYSCPSGHSGSSFAATTVLFFYDKKKGYFALILSLLIVFSRVFLFVHYPTDCIFGAALGILFGLTTVYVYKRVMSSRKAIIK
jgi:undecaprenyl-diphosphatase